MSKYHTAVFIGRFQPFHKAHEFVVKSALDIADEVIIIVGSSFGASTLRNPFSFAQREAMIRSVFPTKSVKIVPVMDYPYNDTKWIKAVKTAVRSARKYTPDAETTVLVGYGKDETSYYLNLFPTWDHVDTGPYTAAPDMSATSIREAMYKHPLPTDLANLSASVNQVVNNIRYFPTEISDWMNNLIIEYDYAESYKKMFGVNPFGKAPIHVTIDAVVTQADKILLIKRKNFPGQGLWALPGGFLEPDETPARGTIRELREETRLKVPDPVLWGSIKDTHTFGSVRRSSRGRVISLATHFELNREKPLPKVKGADDAWKAEWVDIENVDSRVMFEDHAGIIDYFLNIY